MTTEIESIIQRFRAGEMTLDQLADLFAGYEFRPRTGIQEGSETAYVDVIEKIGTPPEEGTWEELSRASSRGLLTDDEYLVILRRRMDRRVASAATAARRSRR